MSMNPVARWN